MVIIVLNYKYSNIIILIYILVLAIMCLMYLLRKAVAASFRVAQVAVFAIVSVYTN